MNNILIIAVMINMLYIMWKESKIRKEDLRYNVPFWIMTIVFGIMLLSMVYSTCQN